VVTTAIGALPGVDTVTVELSTGTVTVSAGQPLDRADIVTAVKEAGYTILV
jgi:copper chaperone CopZ